jgi:hypothetical protein
VHEKGKIGVSLRMPTDRSSNFLTRHPSRMIKMPEVIALGETNSNQDTATKETRTLAMRIIGRP